MHYYDNDNISLFDLSNKIINIWEMFEFTWIFINYDYFPLIAIMYNSSTVQPESGQWISVGHPNYQTSQQHEYQQLTTHNIFVLFQYFFKYLFLWDLDIISHQNITLIFFHW